MSDTDIKDTPGFPAPSLIDLTSTRTVLVWNKTKDKLPDNDIDVLGYWNILKENHVVYLSSDCKGWRRQCGHGDNWSSPDYWAYISND